MDYCTGCGSEIPQGARFCHHCGLAVDRSHPIGDRHYAGGLLGIPWAQLWFLGPVVVGGLLGFIGLFVDWTHYNNNVGSYLKNGFGSGPPEWWTSVIALGAVVGVGLTFLNLAFAVRDRVLPPAGRLRLGALLMGLCPLATHVGAITWIVIVDRGGSGGDAWQAIWEDQNPGLWIALTGGILVFWATSIGGTLASVTATRRESLESRPSGQPSVVQGAQHDLPDLITPVPVAPPASASFEDRVLERIRSAQSATSESGATQLSVSALARDLGTDPANVREAIEVLVKRGVVRL